MSSTNPLLLLAAVRLPVPSDGWCPGWWQLLCDPNVGWSILIILVSVLRGMQSQGPLLESLYHHQES